MDEDLKTQKKTGTTQGENSDPKTQNLPETIQGKNPENRKTVERGGGVKVN